MADLPSEVTLSGLIIIGIATVIIFILVIPFFYQYTKRKRISNLTIAFAMFFYLLAIMSVFVGVFLQYIIKPIEGELQFSRYGFNIGYACSAITNILLILVVSQIFSQAPIFRRTKKAIPLIFAILNGVTIGLIIDTVMVDPRNPAYPLIQTVYHLLLTFIAFSFLLGFGLQARKNAMLRWEKAGFSFICISAVFGILIYIMFVVDQVLAIFVPYFSEGYTIFSHLGWIFGIFMVTFSYIGFIMPKGIRNIFTKEEKIIG